MAKAEDLRLNKSRSRHCARVDVDDGNGRDDGRC